MKCLLYTEVGQSGGLQRMFPPPGTAGNGTTTNDAAVATAAAQIISTQSFTDLNSVLHVIQTAEYKQNVRLNANGDYDGGDPFVSSGFPFVRTTSTSSSGDFEFTGNVAAGGNLNVTGDESVGGDQAVTGNLTVAGTAGLHGTTITGNLSVSGTTTLTGDVTFGGAPLDSVANALTAHAGGGQGSGLALTHDINRVTTVGTAADSVKLPAAVAGKHVVVINAAAANAMAVFPASGEVINALSADASISVAANKTITFWCAVAGTWNSQLTA